MPPAPSRGAIGSTSEVRDACPAMRVAIAINGGTHSTFNHYRRAWRAALKTAKLPLTLRPYDLRRSALRNLIRSGTHETVAMTISGHRTRSTFDRYNITSVDDVAAAIERVAKMAPDGPATARAGGRRPGRT